MVPAACALVTKTKSTVSVSQAVSIVAAARLATATSASWLGLLNFMRIFHQGTLTRRARKFRFGIEMQGARRSGPRIRLFSYKVAGCDVFSLSPSGDRSSTSPASFNLARAAIYKAPRRRSPKRERAGDAHLVQYA